MSTHLRDVWFKVTDLEVVSGSGCTVTTADGEEYLDFSSGIAVTSTGHCHPTVVAAIREQAGKFIHAQVNVLPPSAARAARDPPRGDDAGRHRHVLLRQLGRGGNRSRGEARAAGDRPAERDRDATARFHGRTMMAMAMTTSKTGYRAGYQPLPAGVFVAPFPRPFEWNVDENDRGRARARRPRTAARRADRARRDRGDRDRAGARRRRIHPARRTRTCRACARSATEHGILFVADEVQIGLRAHRPHVRGRARGCRARHHRDGQGHRVGLPDRRHRCVGRV